MTITTTFRTLLLSAILILVGTISIVYSQNPEANRIESLNKQMRSHFETGRFVEALQPAEELLAIVVRLFGPESVQGADAYTNVGTIQRRLENCNEARSNLDKAMKIRDKIGHANDLAKLRLVEALAYCQQRSNDFASAAKNYSDALELLEKVAARTPETNFDLLLAAANNSARLKDFEAANELYIRALRMSHSHFAVNSKQREELMMFRTCLFRPFNRESSILSERYSAESKKLAKEEEINSGVVNGKAMRLGKPAYPESAKRQGVEGVVYVRVRIDTEGRVTNAMPICSNPDLEEAAVAAAKRSRFSPTTKNGVPIEIHGLITFNFIAPR